MMIESVRSMSPVTTMNEDIPNDDMTFKLSTFLSFIAHHEKQVVSSHLTFSRLK